MQIVRHDCGLMNVLCTSCQSFNFIYEATTNKRNLAYRRFTKCCQKGKVVLPNLGPTPAFIQQMLMENSDFGRNFRDNIIHYNLSIAFASRQAELDIPPGFGPYCMRFHGSVYHRLDHSYLNQTNSQDMLSFTY